MTARIPAPGANSEHIQNYIDLARRERVLERADEISTIGKVCFIVTTAFIALGIIFDPLFFTGSLVAGLVSYESLSISGRIASLFSDNTFLGQILASPDPQLLMWEYVVDGLFLARLLPNCFRAP